MRDGATPALLGFNAYNLARMAAIGLNVPAAFVLGTGYCATPQAVVSALWQPALAVLEAETGLRPGTPDFAKGDVITLDGNVGVVYAGVALATLQVPQELLHRLTALRAKGAPADRTAVAATPDALTDHGGLPHLRTRHCHER